MNITIELGALQQRKLFVATPMYAGQCAGVYAGSMCDLTALFAQYAIPMQRRFVYGNIVTRARNILADEFLRSDCTHLMFIDSDIGFSAVDVVTLLALAGDDTPFDVIAGPYPSKRIIWQTVKHAVEQGLAAQDPERLAAIAGDPVLNPIPGPNQTHIPVGDPTEVSETGTGFMLVRRATLETYAARFPQYRYRPDHLGHAGYDGSREITAFFDCIIDEDTRRYLTEDYMFCRNVRKMGGKIWVCPWMCLSHVGPYTYRAELEAIAGITSLAAIRLGSS
jgi:hypothetical protein